MTALPGVFRATVVDGADPSGHRRLLVQATSALSAGAVWAEACVPYRSRSSPPQGSTVWIMFEEGDAARPVWIGTRP